MLPFAPIPHNRPIESEFENSAQTYSPGLHFRILSIDRAAQFSEVPPRRDGHVQRNQKSIKKKDPE